MRRCLSAHGGGLKSGDRTFDARRGVVPATGELPTSINVLGGGAVGVEVAQVSATAEGAGLAACADHLSRPTVTSPTGAVMAVTVPAAVFLITVWVIHLRPHQGRTAESVPFVVAVVGTLLARRRSVPERSGRGGHPAAADMRRPHAKAARPRQGASARPSCRLPTAVSGGGAHRVPDQIGCFLGLRDSRGVRGAVDLDRPSLRPAPRRSAPLPG